MTFSSPPRKRLNSAQREKLYEAEKQKAIEADRGEFPICKLCDFSILPGQQWHENHNRYLPHAIGGEPDGISHARCNREHNNQVATPQVAKLKRLVKKNLDIFRTSQPMVSRKNSDRYRSVDWSVRKSSTGEKL